MLYHSPTGPLTPYSNPQPYHLQTYDYLPQKSLPTQTATSSRRNRRRERPGSRTRNSQPKPHPHSQGGTMPTYAPSPSPLLRQSFDASWMRWKARGNSISTTSSSGLSEGIDTWGEQALKMEERRIFGGGVEDGIEELGLDLCPAMLDVVKFLWGDVDYTDPEF